MIYKREDYIEEPTEGSQFPVRHIEALEPLEGGMAKFVGHVTLGLQTPLGIQQIPVSFEIEAASVQGAFEKFDQCAEPRIEQARKAIEDEIQKVRQEADTRIIRPGDTGMPGQASIIDIGKLKT